MKLESTNIIIVANKAMGKITIKQKSKEPAFIDYEYFEELKNLLNDIYEFEKKD